MKPMQRDVPLMHDRFGRAVSKSAERPRCAMCNKLIRMWTDWIDAPREANTMKPIANWRYEGNRQVVKYEYSHWLIGPDGTETDRYGYKGTSIFGEYERFDRLHDGEHDGWTYDKRLRRVSVWDGETYLPVDQYFCSGDCSRSFATAAYRAGYRIKRSTS